MSCAPGDRASGVGIELLTAPAKVGLMTATCAATVSSSAIAALASELQKLMRTQGNYSGQLL